LAKKEFHVISTGRQHGSELVEIVASIHPYVDFIHLREKTKTARELAGIISTLLEKGVPLEKLVVNDRVDVAAAFKAKGVQLAYHSLNAKVVRECFPNLRIGCSVHSLEEATKADGEGADYCLYGHVFETECKDGILPRGLNELERIVQHVRVPVIAIGGIKPDNVEQVLQTKAAGIAVMSGVFLAANPVAEVQAYASILNKWGIEA